MSMTKTCLLPGCGGDLEHKVHSEGKCVWMCTRCQAEYERGFGVDNIVPTCPNKPVPKMRSSQDIGGMIDYLTARGGCESDIGLLKWVLGEAKSEWQVKYEELERCTQVMAVDWQRASDKLSEKIAAQDAEIRRLKSEPDHK